MFRKETIIWLNQESRTYEKFQDENDKDGLGV